MLKKACSNTYLKWLFRIHFVNQCHQSIHSGDGIFSKLFSEEVVIIDHNFENVPIRIQLTWRSANPGRRFWLIRVRKLSWNVLLFNYFNRVIFSPLFLPVDTSRANSIASPLCKSSKKFLRPPDRYSTMEPSGTTFRVCIISRIFHARQMVPTLQIHHISKSPIASK